MKNSKLKSLALAGWVVAFVLGYGETVHAAEIKGACSSDMRKFCGQVASGDHDGLQSCLDQNQPKLSTGCQQERVQWKAHHEAMLDEAQKVFEACKPDMDKFCKDAESQGPKPLMSCMKAHDQQISATCKNERKNMWAMKADKHKMNG